MTSYRADEVGTAAAASRHRGAAAGRSSKAVADRKLPAAAKKAAVTDRSFSETELGSGDVRDPVRQPIRREPNLSGCLHCPSARCWCNDFADAFADATERIDLRRITEVAGNNALCAKSLNPCFVARLAHLLDVGPEDTFYDLGCGNGSILFQMALITGAKCVGVELSRHNAEVARRTWSILRPELEHLAGRSMPPVEIITGDLTQFILEPEFEDRRNPPKILTSNLLLPRAVTHMMSERFRRLPVGSRLACFDDLYPHGRACSQARDPEAFELFRFKDCVWPAMSVEWCSAEGPFYVHTRV